LHEGISTLPFTGLWKVEKSTLGPSSLAALWLTVAVFGGVGRIGVRCACRPLLAPSIMFRIHEISVPSASEEYEDDKGDYSNTFSVHRTDDSIISGTGWSSFYRDHVIGNMSWNSLGDGYYTHQETEELAELVSRERLEQDNIERSTEHVRRWIQ